MSATTFAHWPGANVDMMGLQWHTISAIVPSLSHFTNGATGNVTVDATTFQAECGLIRNSELSYTPKLNSNQFGDYVVEPLVSGWEQTKKWQARLIFPYQDQLLVTEMSEFFPGSTIVFIIPTSIDIDDSLKSATVQHMNWEYQQDLLFAPIISTVLDAYLIACNIYVQHHTATVDMETGQLLALLPPLVRPPSNWKGCTAPKGNNTWDVWSPGNQHSLSYQKWFISPFRSGAMHPIKVCMTRGGATCYGLSLLELYFMKEIGLDVVLDEQASRPPPPSGPKKVLCSRRQFEHSLSKILASLLWTGAKLGSDAGGFDPTQGSTVVSRQVIKWHLNINSWPLAVALTASLAMLILSICMSGDMLCRQKDGMPIDSAGVLQIIWLTNRLRVLKEKTS
ncbi:hypothetical protein BDR06DRAFT_72418 [Suillus hirtellus]|nr:hypothetical protein BDR06DRAFT_72418 [Suillus hirtellus]